MPADLDHSSSRPGSADIEALFNRLFFDEFNTRLEGGGEEPVYLPADDNCSHNRLVYRADFASSALHETAHWCIAGAVRRQQVDFGYWYAPEDRDSQQQKKFECAEIKPQALEWCFSVAAGLPFQVSVDNFSVGEQQRLAFTARVREQVSQYLQYGLPERAQCFCDALRSEYGGSLLPGASVADDERASVAPR